MYYARNKSLHKANPATKKKYLKIIDHGGTNILILGNQTDDGIIRSPEKKRVEMFLETHIAAWQTMYSVVKL